MVKYTKAQIIKSIKYWQNILDKTDTQLIESASKLLDICSDKFTKAVVFSKDKKFELTNSNIKSLFDIYDLFFFNSKLSTLKDLSLFIGNPLELNHIISEYTGNSNVNLSNYLALYQPAQIWTYDNVNNILRLKITKDAIFVNTLSHRYTTFSYIAQAIMHEMIHAFDMHFGNLLNYTIWAVNNKAPIEIIDYNSHLTTIFKQMKNNFEKNTNIEILTSGNNKDFEELCKDAAENIELLMETDDFKEISSKPFSENIVKYYKNSELVHISDDGMAFSYSFGIPIQN